MTDPIDQETEEPAPPADDPQALGAFMGDRPQEPEESPDPDTD